MIIIESILLILSTLSLIVYLTFFKHTHVIVKRIILAVCLVSAFAILFIRTAVTGHAPFSNLYESLIFFGFLYSIKLLFSKFYYRPLTSLFVIPSIALNLIALLLPLKYKAYQHLAPVLKSFWIYIHVPCFFIGYLSLTFGFALSIINLIKKDQFKESLNDEIKLAFFFMTAGIISGSIWAAQSWASFWSWDPKETWSLIVWLLMLLSLHVKNHKAKFVFVTAAFAAMIFTYFGTTFLIPGLHGYL